MLNQCFIHFPNLTGEVFPYRLPKNGRLLSADGLPFPFPNNSVVSHPELRRKFAVTSPLFVTLTHNVASPCSAGPLHSNPCRYWWNYLGFSLLLAFLLVKPSTEWGQNEAPHTAKGYKNILSWDNSNLFFPSKWFFFQAFYSWHLERRWIPTG